MKLTQETAEMVAEFISYHYDPDESIVYKEYNRIIDEFIEGIDGKTDRLDILQVIHDVCGNDKYFKNFKRELLAAMGTVEKCKNKRELETCIKKRKTPDQL